MPKDAALIHIQYIREAVDELRADVRANSDRTDKALVEVKGLAEGAHARITAFENKGRGLLFGLSLGGGSLGAAIVKWWPFG